MHSTIVFGNVHKDTGRPPTQSLHTHIWLWK